MRTRAQSDVGPGLESTRGISTCERRLEGYGLPLDPNKSRVLLSDSVEQRPALALDADLSQAVRASVYAAREYNKAEEDSHRARFQLQPLLWDIELELEKHDGKILYADDEYTEEIVSLKKERGRLALLLKETKQKLSDVDYDLSLVREKMRVRQAIMTSMLAEAFAAMNLIEPPREEPTDDLEELDLQTVYPAFCQKLQEKEEAEAREGAAIARAKAACRTPAQQAECDARKAFTEAQDHLTFARKAFEARAERCERERHYSKEDREVFDLQWVQKYREMTRELIDAEAAMAGANQQAIDAGVYLMAAEISSNFADHPDDGYRESGMAAHIGATLREDIMDWLATVSDQVLVEAREADAELDEWKAEEVEIWDSRSLNAGGSDRRRIDEWREICESFRER